MTQKDFERIAQTVANTRLYDERDRWEIAQSFSHNLAGTNPRFNAAKFVAACTNNKYGTPEPIKRERTRVSLPTD